jgi:hypothetical protein
MTLGWSMILVVLVGLGLAIAFGWVRSRGVETDPEQLRRREEATRRLYDRAAQDQPPD